MGKLQDIFRLSDQPSCGIFPKKHRREHGAVCGYGWRWTLVRSWTLDLGSAAGIDLHT